MLQAYPEQQMQPEAPKRCRNMRAIDERRFVSWAVGETLILDVIRWCQKPQQYLLVPSFPKEIPDDAIVYRVYFDATRLCFVAVLAHYSFDQVGDAFTPELVDGGRGFVLESRVSENADDNLPSYA